MGKTLEAMLALQAIERQLAEVRRHFNSSSAVVGVQQRRVDQLNERLQSFHEEVLAHQKEAGAVELELKSREDEVNKLRLSLNTTRTNKEYAAVLTQLNSLKADNSKLEDKALKLMQQTDQVRVQSDEITKQIAEAQQYLEHVKQTSSQETARLEQMRVDLEQKRKIAAESVPEKPLGIFNRIASTREGDVMARIGIIGKKPPFQYICGGCNMSITPEHANALRTRDEIRFCDCCGRILYLEKETSSQKA